MDRQTEKQMAERQTAGKINGKTDSKQMTNEHRDRQTDGLTGRQMGGWTDRQTNG